jgi:hypothetical protein
VLERSRHSTQARGSLLNGHADHAVNDAGSRVRRTERRLAHGGLRLTERDLWLLEAVSKFRFATTGQLARLGFGGSHHAARKRLRRLFDHGLVRVWTTSLSAPNVYSITPKGVLAEDEALSIKAPRGLDGNLDHLIRTNDVRVTVTLGLHNLGGELVFWRPDWELRALKSRVAPDALFGVRFPDEVRHYALELDNRSRSPKGFIRKMLGYREFRHHAHEWLGIDELVVLVVCREPRWMERYRRALQDAGVEVPAWFATLRNVDVAGLSAPIWRGAFGSDSKTFTELHDGSLPERRSEAERR